MNRLRFFATKPFKDSVILSKETQSLFENKGNAAVTPKGMLLSHHAVKDTKDSCNVYILETGVELEQVC